MFATQEIILAQLGCNFNASIYGVVYQGNTHSTRNMEYIYMNCANDARCRVMMMRTER